MIHDLLLESNLKYDVDRLSMTENEVPDIPNALIICGNCGQPFAALSSTWCLSGFIDESVNGISKTNSNLSQSTIIRNQPITIHDPCQRWQYYGVYKQLNEELISLKCHKFPVCNKCMNASAELLKSQKEYYQSETKYLLERKEYFSNQHIDKIKNAIKAMQIEIDAMKESVESSIKKLNRIQQQKCQIREKQTEPTVETTGEKLVSYQGGIGSLSICAAFMISTNNHYGCINNCRIGNLSPNLVPCEEIERGFLLMGQLLNNIAAFLNIPIREMKIESSLLLTNEKGVYTRLSIPDLKSKKSITQFNLFLQRFVLICSRVFSHSAFGRSNTRIVYDVDANGEQINGQSCLYSKKNPYLFTQTMKWLLYNFKTIQLYALQQSVAKII